MLKIIIAGGRDFNNQAVCDIVCDKLLGRMLDDIEVLCGEARGADACGQSWAYMRGVFTHYYPANWKDFTEKPCHIKENALGFYNVHAGRNRNTRMGDAADALILFWDGKSPGSKHMLSYAKKLKMPYVVFNYEGSLTQHS